MDESMDPDLEVHSQILGSEFEAFNSLYRLKVEHLSVIIIILQRGKHRKEQWNS